MRWPLLPAIALAIGCRDEGLARLEAARDELCACRTAACGEQAMKKVPAAAKPDPKTQKVAQAMVLCMQRLLLQREDGAHDHEHEHAPPTPTAPTP